MRALSYEGPYRVRVKDKPDPRIEHPQDAVLRVTKTAICGSDLHLLHGLIPDTRVGCTFGHEFAGVVDEEDVLFLSDIFPTGYLGAEMGGIQPGDTVVVFGAALDDVAAGGPGGRGRAQAAEGPSASRGGCGGRPRRRRRDAPAPGLVKATCAAACLRRRTPDTRPG